MLPFPLPPPCWWVSHGGTDVGLLSTADLPLGLRSNILLPRPRDSPKLAWGPPGAQNVLSALFYRSHSPCARAGGRGGERAPTFLPAQCAGLFLASAEHQVARRDIRQQASSHGNPGQRAAVLHAGQAEWRTEPHLPEGLHGASRSENEPGQLAPGRGRPSDPPSSSCCHTLPKVALFSG